VNRPNLKLMGEINEHVQHSFLTAWNSGPKSLSFLFKKLL